MSDIRPIAEQAAALGKPVPTGYTAHMIHEMGYVVDPRVPPWAVLCPDDPSRDIRLMTHSARTGYAWVYLQPSLVLQALIQAVPLQDGQYGFGEVSKAVKPAEEDPHPTPLAAPLESR
jgi:hypothetical protein